MDHIIVNNNTAPDVAGMKALFITEIEVRPSTIPDSFSNFSSCPKLHQRYNKEDDNEGFNSDPMKPRALIIDGR
jgi:hypothetical protein